MHALAQLLEPWKTLYSESLVLSTTITTLHLFALLVFGGLAIGADRSTLRALRPGRSLLERKHQLDELCYLHRPILAGLSVIMITGLLLAAADVETFAVSVVFWVKMGLILLLLLNGIALSRIERTLAVALKNGETPVEGQWIRLRKTTVASLVLWLLTTASGALLTAAA